MKPRNAIVLGAGIVGTCTAVHLVKRGWQVTLVDRRGPGEETSFGNAGVIQREAVEPYAFPRQLGVLARALLRRRTDVRYHARALPRLAGPLLRYFRHSAPARYAAASQAYSSLIAHCLSEHEKLIHESQADELVRREGFHFLYRSGAALDSAADQARRLADVYGIRSAVLDGAQLRAAEPSLLKEPAGGIHWLDPWTVSSPGELVQRYAKRFSSLGGNFIRADAGELRPESTGWRFGDVYADNVVVALGPWSSSLLRRLGYALPLFVKRGYHRHYRGATLRRTILDAEVGYVLAPMKTGTRLTSGVELAPLESPATPVQLKQCENAARDVVELGAAIESEPWVGNRPCVADMLPVIGAATRHAGLWFNFGHGHQGFTLGPVAGRLLAEQMSGETPFLEGRPFSPARFGGT